MIVPIKSAMIEAPNMSPRINFYAKTDNPATAKQMRTPAINKTLFWVSVFIMTLLGFVHYVIAQKMTGVNTPVKKTEIKTFFAKYYACFGSKEMLFLHFPKK